jgi:hypothetical protein
VKSNNAVEAVDQDIWNHPDRLRKWTIERLQLAIDADAFNHGGTPKFAAISVVVRHHNDISNRPPRIGSSQ